QRGPRVLGPRPVRRRATEAIVDPAGVPRRSPRDSLTAHSRRGEGGGDGVGPTVVREARRMAINAAARRPKAVPCEPYRAGSAPNSVPVPRVRTKGPD